MNGPVLVVFCDTGHPPPGSPWGWRERLVTRALGWLKPGFRHCWALVPTATGGWLVFDPLTSGLNVFEPDAHDLARVLDAILAGRQAAVWSNPVRSGRVLGFGPITCVTAVKALLGRRLAAVTPYQLYLSLKQQEMTMGGMFGGGDTPPPPDTSYQDKMRANAEEDRARTERQNKARLRLLRSRASGAGNLLRFDGAAVAPDAAGGDGAAPADTIGG